MNIDCMDEDQIAALRFAFRRLYELNKWPEDRRSYNNPALIHQNHCQHGWERFLPWHRIYLYEVEQALQDVAPDVTLPTGTGRCRSIGRRSRIRVGLSPLPSRHT
jgi:tyrosinase